MSGRKAAEEDRHWKTYSRRTSVRARLQSCRNKSLIYEFRAGFSPRVRELHFQQAPHPFGRREANEKVRSRHFCLKKISGTVWRMREGE